MYSEKQLYKYINVFLSIRLSCSNAKLISTFILIEYTYT